MNRALLRKCLWEAQWLFWACGLAVFAFCWVRVWFVSRLEMGKFKVVIETFREQMDRFFPIEIDALFTYTGRIAFTFEEAIVILCMVIWAIARGTDAVSGELGRGTMEMLLAQPVSRLQVLSHQALVTVMGAFLLAALTWLGTFAGIQTLSAKEEKPQPLINTLLQFPWSSKGKEAAKETKEEKNAKPSSSSSSLWPLPWPKKAAKKEYIFVPLRQHVDARNLLPGAANLFAFGFFIAALSTLVSAFDRYRWRAIGIVVGIYIVQFIIKLIGLSIDELRWLNYCTFFTAYEPQLLVQVSLQHPSEAWNIWRTTTDENARSVLASFGPLGFCLILWTLGGICYCGAAAKFCTRDLPPPL